MSIEDRQLEQLAKRLGASAEENLDVDAVASSVVERLKSSSEHRVWWRRTPVLSAFAAAAALVVAVGILSDNGGNAAPIASDMVVTPTELEALSFDELAEVFDTLSFDAPVSELALVGLDDMSVGQLQELLQTMMEE
jgi:hypothetical protein